MQHQVDPGPRHEHRQTLKKRGRLERQRRRAIRPRMAELQDDLAVGPDVEALVRHRWAQGVLIQHAPARIAPHVLDRGPGHLRCEGERRAARGSLRLSRPTDRRRRTRWQIPRTPRAPESAVCPYGARRPSAQQQQKPRGVDNGCRPRGPRARAGWNTAGTRHLPARAGEIGERRHNPQQVVVQEPVAVDGRPGIEFAAGGDGGEAAGQAPRTGPACVVSVA